MDGLHVRIALESLFISWFVFRAGKRGVESGQFVGSNVSISRQLTRILNFVNNFSRQLSLSLCRCSFKDHIIMRGLEAKCSFPFDHVCYGFSQIRWSSSDERFLSIPRIFLLSFSINSWIFILLLLDSQRNFS